MRPPEKITLQLESGAAERESSPLPSRWRRLLSRDMAVSAWLPFLAITLFHYCTPVHQHWLHDIYRRLYYLPIVMAALQSGIVGGIVVAVCVTVAYVPHAFTQFFEHDPSPTLEKFLEIVLYNVIGVLCGVLSDREKARRDEARRAREGEKGAHRQLERAKRLAALGELVAGIAHEIKNPLHTLKGTAELVNRIVPADRAESDMWKLHQEELLRLERVAERFLSFARPTSPECRDMPLGDILARLGELLGAQAHKSSVVLSVLPSTDLDCIVNVDRDQIVQVLIDIALNGFAAMEKNGGGRMIISGECTKEDGAGYAVITLENDGPSVPEEDLERIFDPFFTTRSEGTGLGLSTAARIVQQHNGTLDVRNLGAEAGVAFQIKLPRSR